MALAAVEAPEPFDAGYDVATARGVFRAYLTHAPTHAHTRGPTLVLLHGANFSALSFSLLVGCLKASIRIVALDARGHGMSCGTVEPSDILCAHALSDDVQAVLRGLQPEIWPEHAHPDSTSTPAPSATGGGGGTGGIVLCGHSMGAAIAAHVCERWGVHTHLPPLPPLRGIIMMDMIEHAAVASLPLMNDIISRMPMEFPSVDHAIDWSLRSALVRLPASARISVPYQLRPIGDVALTCALAIASSIGAAAPAGAAEEPLVPTVEWRAREFMTASSCWWEDWFVGTDSRFLRCPGARLLIIPALERLDDDLLVAQMQGKFATRIIAGAGHVMHEDAPDKVAEAILSFLSRSGLNMEADKLLLQAKLERARQQLASRGV